MLNTLVSSMSELHDEVDHEEHTDAVAPVHYVVHTLFEDAYVVDPVLQQLAKNVNRFYIQRKEKLRLLEIARLIDKAFPKK